MSIATAHAGGQSLETLDAVMDGTDVAARFGRLDAAEGLDCSPQSYFRRGTPEWYAYLEGYDDGRIVAAILVGLAIETEADYVPFQLDAGAYADVTGGMEDEPGYYESAHPYLF